MHDLAHTLAAAFAAVALVFAVLAWGDVAVTMIGAVLP